jgi:plastocyanin
MQPQMSRIALFVVGAALVLTGAACGGGGGDKPGGGASAPAATQPASSAQPTKPAAAKPSTLALNGKDLKFDRDQLEAAAGAVTIAFDNQDGGIPHNLHVFSGSDATGKSVGQTELKNGPVKQTLQLDLEVGRYFYVCDVHPATMTGTLVAG